MLRVVAVRLLSPQDIANEIGKLGDEYSCYKSSIISNNISGEVILDQGNDGFKQLGKLWVEMEVFNEVHQKKILRSLQKLLETDESGSYIPILEDSEGDTRAHKMLDDANDQSLTEKSNLLENFDADDKLEANEKLDEAGGLLAQNQTLLKGDSRIQYQFDVFLTHDWGTDEAGRNNHDRVSQVNTFLKTK